MKGFTLKANDINTSGAIDEGITSIIITCKENLFRLHFGSLDKTGMISQTWYASVLKVGDVLEISLADIHTLSKPQNTLDYNLIDYDKIELDSYYRLKRELIEEGLLLDKE